MKNLLKAFSLSLILCISVISCGKEESNAIVVQMPSSRLETVFYPKIAKEFTEKTGIEVEFQVLPPTPEERIRTIVTAMRSKQSNPDVLWMDVAWVGQIIGSQWLAPFSSDTDVYFPGTIKNVLTDDNKTFAVPMFVDLGMFFYRKDLLEKYNHKVPVTWDELVVTAKDIQQKERAAGNPQFWGYTFSGAQTETLIVYFLEHAMSKGNGMYDANGKLALNTPANMAALQTIVDFTKKHYITAPDNFTRAEGETMEFFQTGNVLFERNWPFVYNVHNADDSPIKGLVGVSDIPKYKGGVHTSGLGGWFFGISSYSDQKEKAQQWIEFVTSYDIQKKMVLDLGFYSARKDLYQDNELLARDPNLKNFENSLQYAVARPVVAYYPEMARILKEKLNGATAGTITVEEALNQSQVELEAIIKKFE